MLRNMDHISIDQLTLPRYMKERGCMFSKLPSRFILCVLTLCLVCGQVLSASAQSDPEAMPEIVPGTVLEVEAASNATLFLPAVNTNSQEEVISEITEARMPVNNEVEMPA